MLTMRYHILQRQTFLIVNEMFKLKENQSQEKHEKKMKQAARINNMNEMQKDLVTELLVFLAKISFRKTFLEWFLVNRTMEEQVRKRTEVFEGIKSCSAGAIKVMHFLADQ